MLDPIDDDPILVAVIYQGACSYYRAGREIWVLDRPRWSKMFNDAGYETPPDDASERFGIHIVDASTADAFLAALAHHRHEIAALQQELLDVIDGGGTWADAGHFFPELLVDFDRRVLITDRDYATTPLERLVPEGWSGSLGSLYPHPTDANAGSPIPESARFWIAHNRDLFAELSARS